MLSPALRAASASSASSDAFSRSLPASATLPAPRSPQSPRPSCTKATSSRITKSQKKPQTPLAAAQKGPPKAAAQLKDQTLSPVDWIRVKWPT